MPNPAFSVFGTGSFMSYDNTDEDAFGIGGWAPGAEPYSLPEGLELWLQNVYALHTPLHIPAGSRIDAWFVWDNSAGHFDNPFNPP